MHLFKPLFVLSRFSSASSDRKSLPTVGKYEVQIKSFETVALQALMLTPEEPASSRHRLIVIDEIGKMELFSQEFVQLVRTLFEQKQCTLLATIPIARGRPIALVEDLRQSPDCQVFAVKYTGMHGPCTCTVYGVCGYRCA